MIASKLSPNDNKDSMPDPDMTNYKPVGGYIVVRQLETEEKTAGGLYIPDAEREDFTRLNAVGRVLAISETAHVPEVHGKEPWYKVGDYVVWPKLRMTKIPLKGVEISLVDYEHVMMVVSDPSRMDLGGYRLKA